MGYPDKLKPMLTEFGGMPVAGGTLPAQIWKTFMTAADTQAKLEPEQFPATPYLGAQEKRIVWRGGSYKLDNGYCPGTRVVAYFDGRGPATQAECYANEVTVPLVIGKTVDAANDTLSQKPLGSEVIGVLAKPGKRPGFVVKQEPRTGFLSANGTVRLYVTRPDPPLWAAAEPDRLERHGRPLAAPLDQGTHHDHLRQGPGRLGARAEAGRRRRCRARAEGHARRGPLTEAQRVPLTR